MEANWITTLLIGSILSIPISILANIMTPTFKKWFDQRARTAHGKSLAELKKEYEQTKIFKEQPALFQFAINEYVIKGLIVLSMMSLGMAYFTLVYVLSNLPSDFPLLSVFQSDILRVILMLLSLTAWMLALIFIASMTNGLNNLWIKYSRLQQFKKYENDTLAKIRELEKNITKRGKK